MNTTVMPAEHHAEINKQPRPKRSIIKVVLLLAVVIAGYFGVQAALAATASLKTTSDVEIRVYERNINPGTPNSKVRLNGVSLIINEATSGPGCNNNGSTSADRADINTRKTESGLAIFRDCSNGGSKRTYKISSATKTGYIEDPKTPHHIKTSVFHVYAGNKKKRNTVLSYYMIKGNGGGGGGGVTPPPPPPPGGVSHSFVKFQCGSTPPASPSLGYTPGLTDIEVVALTCQPETATKDTRG